MWVFGHEKFKEWQKNTGIRLLWIKGDAGKGKTMLMCGIINELSSCSNTSADSEEKNKNGHSGKIKDQPEKIKGQFTRTARCRSVQPRAQRQSSPDIVYFFCQATDNRLNHAIGVLRGLIYLLLHQRPSLISYLFDKYKHTGPSLFEEVSFYSLCQVLIDMFRDTRTKGCVLVIDALDECEVNLGLLVEFIAQSISEFTHIKWVISSRNIFELNAKLLLNKNATIISLEQNAETLTQSINVYIKCQVSSLLSLKHDFQLQQTVLSEMRQRANSTFLWVSLVAKELQGVQNWDVLGVLREIPPGLQPLYSRMMSKIHALKPEQRGFCKALISAVLNAYRPLNLREVGVLAGLPESISDHVRNLNDMVVLCGSFLTIRRGYVYLIHQSAKDFFIQEATGGILSPGKPSAHAFLLGNSLCAMSKVLRRNIYSLHHPGTLIGDVQRPDPDPLARVHYSCIYWIDHLMDALCHTDSGSTDILSHFSAVNMFFCKKFLFWLEALSLLKNLSRGAWAISRLSLLSKENDALQQLRDLIQDANRFLLSHQTCIEMAPLQTYVSALFFSPERSLIRTIFSAESPTWVLSRSPLERDWNACIRTFQGHDYAVNSIALLPDGQHLLSASRDTTIKLWDIFTGNCICTLYGHEKSVFSVVCSGNGQLAVSGSMDRTVKLWDIHTQTCIRTLEGHVDMVRSVDLSTDARTVASASDDCTIRIWDIRTTRCVHTLTEHTRCLSSVLFSANDQLLSGSSDGTVKIWNTKTGHCVDTLRPQTISVYSLAIYPSHDLISFGLGEGTIKIWDIYKRAYLKTLTGHAGVVESVAFLNEQQLASCSRDGTVKVWHIVSGDCLCTFQGHSLEGYSIACSPDGQQIISGSMDETIKIWDVATGSKDITPHDHKLDVTSITLSQDGLSAASTLRDCSVKIWDLETGSCIRTLRENTDSLWANSACFSNDGQRILSTSVDEDIIHIWDIAANRCIHTVYTQSPDHALFSMNGQQVISSSDMDIEILDIATKSCLRKLQGHTKEVTAITVSKDEALIISGSEDTTVKIWDKATGNCTHTLEGNTDRIFSVAISEDNQQVASSCDDAINVWNISGQSYVRTHSICIYTRTFNLSFNPKMSPKLMTDVGVVHLPTTFDELNGVLTSPVTELRADITCSGYSRSADLRWITKNGRRMLYLPTEYRAWMLAIVGSTVVLGCGTGRVIILKFL